MSFQESPAQRAARSTRDAFFGRPPLTGPALPTPSRVRENPAQTARRNFLERFFQPHVERESAVKAESRTPSLQPSKDAKLGPKTGGKTKNEALGGTLIVKDCQGTELFRIPKLMGLDGEQELRAGCDDSSSGSIG